MNKYSDIIEMPHHVSRKHKHMSVSSRAAQFSPFAALSGYDGQIIEEARLTNNKLDIREDSLGRLNETLGDIIERIKEKPLVEVTYFKPDDKKDGGKYVSLSGCVRRVDEVFREMIFTDGSRVSLNDVLDLKIQEV